MNNTPALPTEPVLHAAGNTTDGNTCVIIVGVALQARFKWIFKTNLGKSRLCEVRSVYFYYFSTLFLLLVVGY